MGDVFGRGIRIGCRNVDLFLRQAEIQFCICFCPEVFAGEEAVLNRSKASFFAKKFFLKPFQCFEGYFFYAFIV